MFNNIQKKHNYVESFEETVKAFGGEFRNIKQYIMREKINFVRNPLGNYFGCINPEEEKSGPYSDLSVVVFPSNENNDADDRWLVAVVVGTSGFKEDGPLVTLPGTRRTFVNRLSSESFVKNDFQDIGTKDGFDSYCKEIDVLPTTLKDSIKKYATFILACSLVDPNDIATCETVMKKYLAIYALLRGWADNSKLKMKEIQDAAQVRRRQANELQEITELLETRKYIVLQGAPGTGKTRMAKSLVPENAMQNVFFTQFHAETTYSDFVYGILPETTGRDLKYIAKEGVFVKAIKKAQAVQEKGEKVYLIIDEINRANLSNVLGPAFYLFEPTMSASGIAIEVYSGLSLSKLPTNLYVIATMNTADRSLAVVDFALRRRFAWYTMYPHEIVADDGLYFCKDEFDRVAKIFEQYATDEELMLQPGQAYFIVPAAKAQEAIKLRLKYEVMPLIKEYFNAGLLARSKDDFVDFFRKEIDEEMYR